MRNRILTVGVIFIGLIGVFISLQQMYATSDDIPRPFISSSVYLGTALLILFVFYNFEGKLSLLLKLFNTLLMGVFSVFSFLMALIAIYAAPIENQSFPLAATLFFCSGLIGISSIVILFNRKIGVKIGVR